MDTHSNRIINLAHTCRKIAEISIGIIAIITVSSACASAAEKPAKNSIDAAALPPQIAQAELVFTGKVASVQEGPTAQSFPPIYGNTLWFSDAEAIRGDKPGKDQAFLHRARQVDRPNYPADVTFLVAANRNKGDWVVAAIVPADEKNIAAAKQSSRLPLGWKMESGKPVSPWAKLSGKAWPKDAPPASAELCSVTGRPVLMAGKDIEITSEQVKAEKFHEFKNPFGDGQFKITVTNTGDKPAVVPALLKAGDTIRWADSLVVLQNNKPYVLPGAGGAEKLSFVELKPGESLSTTIDVLPLDLPDWPQGGSRVYFQFALGEKATDNFFYYFTNWHEPLRKKAVENAKTK